VRTGVEGNLAANDGEMIRDMTLAGTGISLLPDFFVAGDIAAGRLVPLLSGSSDVEAGIFAVYPATRHLSATVRALLDFLAAQAREEASFPAPAAQ
jgi:DNA-binding transcriptional LysR family regulator